MEYRGYILIVFGISPMMSPLAIRMLTEKQAERLAATPEQVITQGQAEADCNEQSIQTAIGRIGCLETSKEATVRRIDQRMVSQNPARNLSPSGALFVGARN